MEFKHAPIFKVLVASYETLRKYTADLRGCCDLLVCDEGHRLKAAGGSKTMESLLALDCPRRILLTGTPLQNNLDEFWGELPPFTCTDLWSLRGPNGGRR
jgi:DNA repair and recombination protein RAD54B